MTEPSPVAPLAAARSWPFLIAALAILTALLFAYPVARMTSPMSFNYSEGWNAFWGGLAQNGQPLYADLPGYTTVNYPPISFHLDALLSRLTDGDVNLVGRFIGLSCLLWSAANVGVAARHVTASAGAGWLAAVCLLLWIALGTISRVGTNDPHFLALALSTLGMCAFLQARGRQVWMVAAATLFATALFVKNAMIGFPLAATLYLAANRQWRALATYAIAGIATAAFWFTLTLAVDGRFFLAHVLAVRLFDRASGLSSLGRTLTFLYAPLLIAIVGVMWRGTRHASYPTLCLLCAAAVDIGFVFGNGVADNIYYEALAALAVVVASSVDLIRRSVASQPQGGAVAIASALLAVGSVLVWAPGELYAALGRMDRLPGRTADYEAGTEFIRTAPGPALCESLLMCFKAGKPFVFDAYYVKDQIGVGRLSERQLVDDLNERRFGVVEIGEDDPAFTLSDEARLRFTSATMHALLLNYRIVLRKSGFAILMPL